MNLQSTGPLLHGGGGGGEGVVVGEENQLHTPPPHSAVDGLVQTAVAGNLLAQQHRGVGVDEGLVRDVRSVDGFGLDNTLSVMSHVQEDEQEDEQDGGSSQGAGDSIEDWEKG